MLVQTRELFTRRVVRPVTTITSFVVQTVIDLEISSGWFSSTPFCFIFPSQGGSPHAVPVTKGPRNCKAVWCLGLPMDLLPAFQPQSPHLTVVSFFSLSHCSFSTFGFIWPLPGMGLGCNAAFSIQEIHRDLYCVGVSAHVRLKSFFLDYQLDERPGCIPRKLSLVGVTFPNSP